MQFPTQPLLAALVVIAGLALAGTSRAAAAVDNSLYAQLLSRHVHNGGVDYQGFKKDEKLLDQYLGDLALVQPDQLDRHAAMAFFINLYNAWTIKLILSKYPDVTSIKDLGGLFRSPWKKKLVQFNGQTVTLDHIEHDILRPRYQDSRIHFAVNCASKSCPPLIPVPYDGEKLNQQLDEVTKAFINDPASNHLEGDTLRVSRIFKWYAEDFNHDVIAVFKKYARDDLKEKLEALPGKLKISYLEYDWSLNSAKEQTL